MELIVGFHMVILNLTFDVRSVKVKNWYGMIWQNNYCELMFN